MSSAAKSNPSKWKRIVSQVKASGKGGSPGQWSARKAQLLAQAYKRRGGGYTGEKTEGQKSLKRWGDQKWMTKQEYEKKNK